MLWYPLGSLKSFVHYKRVEHAMFIYSKRQLTVILKGCGKAFQYMHENSFAHCDIKSDNVLLQVDET